MGDNLHLIMAALVICPRVFLEKVVVSIFRFSLRNKYWKGFFCIQFDKYYDQGNLERHEQMTNISVSNNILSYKNNYHISLNGFPPLNSFRVNTIYEVIDDFSF